MKKRLLSIVLAAVLALACVLSLAACSDSGSTGKKNETVYTTPDFVPSDYPKDDAFKGAISKDSYTSTENAAKAFLQNEIAGDATDATFKEYTKKGDLSAEELRGFASITSGFNVTSAERGEISYEDNATSASGRNAKAGGEPGGSLVTVKLKKTTLYIFVIDFSNYKYFAPELNKGDVITQSYYDEVFDQGKYVNCTVNELSTATVTVKVQGQSVKTEMVSDSTVMLTEDYCFCSAKMETKTYLGKELMDSASELDAELFYVFDEEGNITKMFMRTDGGSWREAYTATVDIRDYTTPKMDKSFFVKMDYGFTVNREKFSLYLQEAVNNIANNSGMSFDMSNLKSTYDFMVKNGRLDKAVLTMTGKVNAGGQTADYSQNVTTTYTKFGSTSVTVPNGIILDNNYDTAA